MNIALSWIGWLAVLIAQDPTPETSKPQEPAATGTSQDSDLTAARVMPVTLEQCIQLAEQNSLRLRIDSIDVQIAKADVFRALGRFDTSYFFTTSYNRNRSQTTSIESEPGTLNSDGSVTPGDSKLVFKPLVTEGWQLNTGFRGTLVNGATYTVDLDYQKSETEIPDPGPLALDPSYRSSIGVAITQPLLRGNGTTVNKATLLNARNSLMASSHALEESRVQRANEVIIAYWNFYFSRRNHETQLLLVEQSQSLVEINRRKQAVGTMKSLDVLEAESELARRQSDLIVAKSEIGRSADQLKRLIFDFEDRELWAVDLLPLTDASADFVDPPAWRDALTVALERRPELRRRRELLKNNDIAIVVAENGLLPRLDLDASLRFNRLAGSKGEALNYSDDIYSLSAGISLEVPIGNRTARGDMAAARLRKAQALFDYRDAENQVIQDVRNGVREVVNSRKEIEAARESVRLAALRFSQEMRRRDIGASTTFLVRESQAAWREAVDAETRALFNYEVAKAALDTAQGSLLEKYGILPAPTPSVNERAGVHFGP